MRAFLAIVKLTFRHAVRSHIFQLLLGDFYYLNFTPML